MPEFDFNTSQFDFNMFDGNQYGSPSFDNLLPKPEVNPGGFQFGGGAGATPKPNAGGFDFGGQGGANISAGIQGVGSLANALMAYKQYQLGKDSLAFQKDVYKKEDKRNVKNYNMQLLAKAENQAKSDQRYANDFEAMDRATQDYYNKQKLT